MKIFWQWITLKKKHWLRIIYFILGQRPEKINYYSKILNNKNIILEYIKFLKTKYSYKKPLQPLFELFHAISLRLITGCPWYVWNLNLRNDQQIPSFKILDHLFYKKFYNNRQKSTYLQNALLNYARKSNSKAKKRKDRKHLNVVKTLNKSYRKIKKIRKNKCVFNFRDATNESLLPSGVSCNLL